MRGPCGSTRRRQFVGGIGAIGAMFALSAAPPALTGALTAELRPLPEPERLTVPLGVIGARLVAAGVIDPLRFAEACARAGEPLDEARQEILTHGSDHDTTFDQSKAHFLLNLLWGFGLANRNPILTSGAMMRDGIGSLANFASTGGWTPLAAKPVMDIYAAVPLVALTHEQQGHLVEAASGVYRPCCDNPTSFPDCNHGMAMLGLLTLLAAQDRDADVLFGAAKTANRFWFPQPALQVASYVSATRGVTYANLDPREASGRALFSGSGFRTVSAWFKAHSPSTPADRGGCAA